MTSLPLHSFLAENNASTSTPSLPPPSLLDQKPWLQSPHYFTRVKISALALLKMVTHAKSGGDIEIMGLTQGHIIENAFVIQDSFPLPVEGTETRVNAAAEAYEYMVQHTELAQRTGKSQNVNGWYHSHPGYGCWLSGIDVSTQMINQQFQEPWIAIVIDPHRTISAGKVEIGAFRTFPKEYTGNQAAQQSEYQTIPLDKIEDFGVHANQYYQLEVEISKSQLDDEILEKLWSKYWINTLSSSALLTNHVYHTGQLKDVANKVGSVHIDSHHSHSSNSGPSRRTINCAEIAKVCSDADKMCVNISNGLRMQLIKNHIFNSGIGQHDPLDLSSTSHV